MQQFTPPAQLWALVLSSLFLLPHYATAQVIAHEATYPTTDLHRLNLPSGEIWYYDDKVARKIVIRDGNHRNERFVPYPSENNATVSLDVATNMPVSDNVFNSDRLLEFIWRFQYLNSTVRKKIYNENNAPIDSLPIGDTLLFIHKLEGCPNKLFVENRAAKNDKNKTSVYSLPSLRLEKIFDGSDLRRQRFGYAGVKYYIKRVYLKPSKNMIQIYDTNFVYWKHIDMRIDRNTLNFPDPVFFADDNFFNRDSAIEFMFTYHHAGGTFVTKILDTFGRSIVPSVDLANSKSRFNIESIKGEPNKLIFNESYHNDEYYRSRVYGLPLIKRRFEGKYDSFRVKRVSFKFSKAKYQFVDSFHDKIRLCDTLHKPWKTARLIPTLSFRIDYNSPQICDSTINKDTLLETIWIERTYDITSLYNLRITKENGDNLATIPNASSFTISHFDGLENKLVTKMSNGTGDFETQVWRFTARTPVQDPSVSTTFDVHISPNPFTTSFTISDMPTDAPLSIRLFDAVGRLVFSEKINAPTLSTTLTPPNTLPRSVYVLELTSEGKRTVKRLVKM
jgi:hypothetical protein